MYRRITRGATPTTAGQAAANLIRQKILNGDLPPGATLNQSELAAALGMSRIPIRDALRSLAAEGLVRFKAHSSASVAPLSLGDLQELYEIRLALEPRLCRLALPQIRAPEITELERMVGVLEAPSPSAEWVDTNDRFHWLMYRHSGRPRSIQIVDRAREATARYTSIFRRVAPAEIDVEHRQILDAVRAGQAQRLESMVATHLAGGYETMMQYLSDGGNIGYLQGTTHLRDASQEAG